MVSLGESTTMASPRISFSSDFVDDDNDSFISISPKCSLHKDETTLEKSKMVQNGLDFEFLSNKNSSNARDATMLTADELIFQGKLLPYSQINHATNENLTKINLKSSSDENNNNPVYPIEASDNGKPKETPTKMVNESVSGILLGREPQEPRICFVDDDPSPRPPNCTVLWKELLRLKKQRSSTSTMSPSLSSSSSSSSSRSSSSSLGNGGVNKEEKENDEVKQKEKEKHIKKIKKGALERTRSANNIKFRPMFNVPISTQTTTKSSSLPPLFPLRKNKIDR